MLHGVRPPSVEVAVAPPRAGRADVALPREVRSIIALVAFWMLASALVLPFFNIFFTDRFALPVPSVGSLFALASVVNAIVLIGAAEVARRFGPRRALTWWMVALAPGLWGLAAANALSLVIALYVIQGLVAPATNPLIDQLVLERVDRTRHGVVAGWRNAAAEVAGAVGATAGGHLLDASSFATLFLAAGAVAAAASVLLMSALRATPAPLSSSDSMADERPA
jgi:predicted MFS family arabinose efflux permease